jgi:gliding motility-associated-like protein
MRNYFFLKIFLCLVLWSIRGFSQTYSPVPLTGFNQDVVAETGTSSLTTTTMALDGVPASNKVMYTIGFRTSAGLGGGGIPDNGTIVNGASTYQLAPYTSNNCYLIQRGQNRDITLATPAKYSKLRLLGFTTEGTSLLNITTTFSDGTSVTTLSNYSLGDWFNGTTNVVLQGFGRCTRATPASGADAFNTNPRMYFIELPITCADAQKSIVKINVANATTAGTNAPYPNTIIMALSGVAYTSTTFTSNITNATCTSTGTATLTLTGMSPFAVAWNTSPVQTGVTATNLTVGNYTATITDANNCNTTANVTVGLANNLTLSNRNDTAICFGASFIPTFTSNATNFSWTPTSGVSNAAILNPTLSPTAFITYTITGTTGTCTINKSFNVNVAQNVVVNAGPDVTILAGQTVQLQGSGTIGTYLWTPSTGLSATNIINPLANPVTTTTYSLRTTTAIGCTNTDDVMVTVVPYCVKPMEAFTPNGDGINDRWLITNGNCLKTAKVMVYNRYGSLVYENENYTNNWDGTYKGKAVPDATYYYKIEYTLINNQKVFSKGDVTVLR